MSVRCLILACGNTLRGDDGVGPWLADWAEEHFAAQAEVRVVSRQQWTPELAEEIAGAESVIFVDSSVATAPGAVRLTPVDPGSGKPAAGAHHMDAEDLLALGRELYGSLPRKALLLTVGAGASEMGEGFSVRVKAALPDTCDLLDHAVRWTLTAQKPH
ncbi:MAG: hydrogenase maturation protease [Terracidiphilus sp.]